MNDYWKGLKEEGGKISFLKITPLKRTNTVLVLPYIVSEVPKNMSNGKNFLNTREML